MARADLLLSLAEAAGQQDDAAVKRTVEALIADERGKRHHILADRLEETLRESRANVRRDSGSDVELGVEVVSPRRTLESLVLHRETVTQVRELIEEQMCTDLLRTHGLEPRHRVLLTGPPGNGKTSLAEAIAEALLVPLVRIRYEAVISSYLGDTGARLARVFEFARTRHCVLLLDEFDAIAKERGDLHDTGEIKRVVSSLLLFVDDLPSHVVLVAASNHPELLDRAAGRRFELCIELSPPTRAQRVAYSEAFLGSLGEPAGVTAQRLADATAGLSFSRLHDFAMDVRRRRVLEPERGIRQLIEQRLRRAASEAS